MAASLAGKRVLVTGASAGIGRKSARRFVAQGAHVIAVARSGEQLERLAEEVGGSQHVTVVTADLADARSAESMARQVLAGGVPDVVVANAGIGMDALFVETSDENLRRVLEINLFGVVRSVRPFLPGMIERGSGRIVLVSSIVGKRGIPHYGAYAASKFALHGIADSLRPELVGSGVSVGLVCPVTTDTEFHERKLREGPEQKRARPAVHSAESVARAIVQMSRSRRRERVLTAEGKFLVLANALVPSLVDRVLARMMLRGDADRG